MENITKEKGFTLAEVLITLVIIGVVAAITVPMLMNDTNDKKWNVARQKAQATIGEAFRLATVNGEIDKNISTENFVKNIIPKYLKIAKTCNNATDCGFSTKNKRPDGVLINTTGEMPVKWSDLTRPWAVITPASTVSTWNAVGNVVNNTTKDESTVKNSYFFQTLDGFSVNFFYNPYCAYDSKDKAAYFDRGGLIAQMAFDRTCFNAIYDMNGAKGPNTVGKDIGFIGSIYNGYETRTAAILPYNEEKEVQAINGNYFLGAVDYCKNLDKDYNWVLPNIDELTVMVENRNLITTNRTNWFWSSTPSDIYREWYWRIEFSATNIPTGHITWDKGYVRCVRNTALK